MESFSEKDAARSKFKLSQKNRRGRGRGAAPGGGRSGGRGRGGGGGSAATRDLGTNEDRYLDEAAPELGPVRQSQGADLAQLLAQAEPFDHAFYYRCRVNLAEEFGLPPETEAGGYQGLSIDLKGLATCLDLLPKNQLLDTDAFSEEDAGEDDWSAAEGASNAGSMEGELPDLEHQPEQPSTAEWREWLQQRGTQAADIWSGVHLSPPQTATAASDGPAQPAADAAHALPQGGFGAGAMMQAGSPAAIGGATAKEEEEEEVGIEELLSGLLGEKATLGSRPQQQTAAPPTRGATGISTSALAPAPYRPSQLASRASQSTAAPPPVQQQQRQEQKQEQGGPMVQQQQGPPKEQHDDELEMLLGLTTGPAVLPGAEPPLAGSQQKPEGSAGGSSTQATAQAQGQSLGDWLDGL